MSEVQTTAAAHRPSRFLTNLWIVMACFAALAMLQLLAPQLFPTGAEIVIQGAPGSAEWVGTSGTEAPLVAGASQVDYSEGNTFQVAVQVRNTGPFAFTVDGVDTNVPDGLARPLSAAPARSTSRNDILAATVRSGTSVQPGASLTVVLTERFGGCARMPAGQPWSLTVVGIRAAALHVNRTIAIELPRPVRVMPPAACPGRR